MARKDKDIIGITAAMPSGTGLNIFQKEVPGQFYDVGIAEEHAVLFAAGLATQGKKPVVAIYSTFLQRAYDQIIHDVCLQKLPSFFAWIAQVCRPTMVRLTTDYLTCLTCTACRTRS